MMIAWRVDESSSIRIARNWHHRWPSLPCSYLVLLRTTPLLAYSRRNEAQEKLLAASTSKQGGGSERTSLLSRAVAEKESEAGSQQEEEAGVAVVDAVDGKGDGEEEVREPTSAV